MTAIHVDIPDLTSASLSWLSAVPTEVGSPPVATPATDPISCATLAATAVWPAVHEMLVAERSSRAQKLVAANGGTAAILGTTDAENAALIEQSGPKA